MRGHILGIKACQLHLRLGFVIGSQPEQVGAEPVRASDTGNGRLVKCLAGCEPVCSTAVEVQARAIQGIAKVQGIAVDQEAIANGELLPPKGKIEAILSKRRNQVT